MAEPITCAAFDASAAELAFELVEPRLRDLLIAHAAGCDRCRRELESLSVTADLLVLLAPEGEPPIGFEQRALAAMSVHRRSRVWVALAAAAVLFVVGLGIGWRHTSDSSASNFRQAALVGSGGKSFGTASIATGDEVVLTMSLKGLDVGNYRCLVQYADGAVEDVATWPIGDDGAGAWAVTLDAGSASVRSVLLEEDDGTRIATALLP
jgi:hypothetical protein